MPPISYAYAPRDSLAGFKGAGEGRQEMDGWEIDRQRDRRTDRYTNGQSDGHTETGTYSHLARQGLS